MIPATRCPCAHCGHLLDLSATHLLAPYRRQHWWHVREQRSEYLCPRCGQFSVLRPSRGGALLYLGLAVALATAAGKGVPLPVLGLVGLMVGALLFRHAVRLAPAG